MHRFDLLGSASAETADLSLPLARNAAFMHRVHMHSSKAQQEAQTIMCYMNAEYVNYHHRSRAKSLGLPYRFR